MSASQQKSWPGRVGRAVSNWWLARKTWQRRVMITAVAAIMIVTWMRWQRWEETSKPNTLRKMWERNGVVQTDENGDGRIDEEKRPGRVPGEFILRKDANFDGTFDVRYRQLTNGLATDMEVISEKAPRR